MNLIVLSIMADSNDFSFSGYTIILITAIIGGLIIATGIYFGTKMIDDKNKMDSDKRILELQEALESKNDELQNKQDSIRSLTSKVLGFSKVLDSNTKEIREIAKNISEISTRTNQISNLIRDELREKGFVYITPKFFEKYNLKLGGNSFYINREVLIEGYDLKIADDFYPINLKIKDDKLLITTKIFDYYGNLIVEINKGE